jgi:hypothetical protein
MSELSDSDDERSSTSDENDTAERQAAMDRLVPALESSEYGRMPPSFHSNSQRVRKNPLWTDSSPTKDQPKQDVASQPKAIRPLIFPRDQFDGVEDSDDETEEEENALVEREEEEEEGPQIVGELEIDMEQEAEEFLKFSREALGISSDMWTDIIRDRRGRDGTFKAWLIVDCVTYLVAAFIPPHALREEPLQNSPEPSASTAGRAADLGMHPSTDPDLKSFEAVMKAMDAELTLAKQDKQLSTVRATTVVSPTKSDFQNKGKHKAHEGDEGDDMGAVTDAELRATLQDSSDDEDRDKETSIDYTLMKNFLESFKSQQGLPGPVGNLIGRLGWQLPRDES